MPRPIYLDCNATTPLDPRVRRAMVRALAIAGNPSSAHAAGRAARKAVEDAREDLARAIGARPDEIVFTSGGTESNNLASLGGAREARARTGRDTVLTTPLEHPSVVGALALLAREGFRIVTVPVDGQGVCRAEHFESALGRHVALACVQWAQNEVGTVQPIERLVRMARAHDVPLFTDAVQAVGKVRVRVDEVGCDLLSMAAHKLHGPKGVGALYVRKGTRLSPLLVGGHQEGDLRPGTENVAGIVGLARAVRLAVEDLPGSSRRMIELRERLWDGIRRLVPDAHRNGSVESGLPNTLHVSFPGQDAEGLVIALDLEGVCVSAGAACASGAREPSAVLRAMGVPDEVALGSVRFSMGRFTREGEVTRAMRALRRVLARARASPGDARR